MKEPKLACCNFIVDPGELRRFARKHGFDGIDWSFHRDTLPKDVVEEGQLADSIRSLEPLGVRYHCAFARTDLGDEDAERAKLAMRIFRSVCRIVAKLGGDTITIHVGLGHDSTLDLSWDRTIESLRHLVRHAEGLGLRLCLENLAWGWTSRPNLFEKLVRKSGAWTTLDIGHAAVSPSVQSQHYDLHDFTTPQEDRFLNAHIYHLEDERGHIPPSKPDDVAERLRLLQDLPACDWWVLELREEDALLQTLQVVRAFLDTST